MKILLYPCEQNFLNILESNASKLKCIISGLGSPQEWDVIGRKVNLGKTFLEVKDNITEDIHKCDAICIVNSRKNVSEEIVEKYKRCAYEYNKKVFDLRKIGIRRNDGFLVDNALKLDFETDMVGELEVPIIMLANVFGDNGYENLRLHSIIKNNLEKDGYSVLSIVPEMEAELFGWHSYYKIIEKDIRELSIEKLKEYISYLQQEEDADIIVVNVPENLVRYSTIYLGDCGVSAYMLSRALLPDIIVVGLLYGDYNKEYMESLCYELECIFGQEIDFFVMQNQEMDIEETIRLHKLQTVQINHNLVMNNINILEMDNIYSSDSNSINKLGKKSLKN